MPTIVESMRQTLNLLEQSNMQENPELFAKMEEVRDLLFETYGAERDDGGNLAFPKLRDVLAELDKIAQQSNDPMVCEAVQEAIGHEEYSRRALADLFGGLQDVAVAIGEKLEDGGKEVAESAYQCNNCGKGIPHIAPKQRQTLIFELTKIVDEGHELHAGIDMEETPDEIANYIISFLPELTEEHRPSIISKSIEAIEDNKNWEGDVEFKDEVAREIANFLETFVCQKG